MHWCQGATCPGLDAASGVDFCSFSAFFFFSSGPGKLFYFSGETLVWTGELVFKSWRCAGALQVGGIWRWGVSWLPRQDVLGEEAEMEVEQSTDWRSAWDESCLKPDCGPQCHMSATLFKLNGSRSTQTEAILHWTWNQSGPVWFRKGRSTRCSNRKQLFRFSPPEGGLGTAHPQTGHLTLYSHEFIKSHHLSCAITLLFLEGNQILSVVNKHCAGPPTFLFIFKTPGVPWMTSSIWPRKIRDEKCCPTAGKNISIWLHYYKLPWVRVHWITVLSGS